MARKEGDARNPLSADCVALATQMQEINQAVEERSQQLEGLGFGLFDSFHLACAEAAGADIFLSTDDRLLKNPRRYESQLKVTISNPVIWLIQVLEEQSIRSWG